MTLAPPERDAIATQATPLAKDPTATPEPSRGEAIAVGLLGSAVGVLVLVSARTVTNTDTYFHLRFGHEFLTAWTPWHPGSVASDATARWVPTQWLSEVVMALVEDVAGLAGVVWLFGALSLLLLALLYSTCRREAQPAFCAVVVSGSLFAMAYGLSPRPQLVSFLFLTITVRTWLGVAHGRRAPWWLIPMSWLWALCHGMWILGVVIDLVAVSGILADSADRRSTRRLLAIPVGALLAGAVTPVGPRLLLAVLAVGERSQYYSEWRTPDLISVAFAPLVALLVVAVIGLTRTRPRWLELSLLGLAGLFAVYSVRTVPVAVIVAAPLACRAWTRLRSRPRSAMGTRERSLVASIVIGGVVVLACVVPFTSRAPLAQPSSVATRLSALPAGTAVFTDISPGGYLTWRYPQLDPVSHGYGDTYTLPELQRIVAILALDPGWDDDLRAVGARWALLRPDLPLAYALQQQHWTVVAGSGDLELLRAPDDW